MAQKAHSFCIAGAGIAGLTLALALAKYGAQVTVLERHASVQEVGAGLQISPNATKILQALGLTEALQSHAMQPQGIDIFPFKAKKPLLSLALGDEAQHRYGAPYYVMRRADLADILHTACRRFANIDIRFDVRSFDVEETTKGLSVSFSTATGNEKRRAHAFIGADGVGSPTRTRLLDGPDFIETDYTAWRTMVPMAALAGQFSPRNTSLIWSRHFHCVAYPMANHDSYNIALFTGHADAATAPPLPNKAKQDPRIDAILTAAKDWTYWPLRAVKTPVWHRGAVGLIGDAAHAMLPFQAQGAAMAIEDAMCLAQNLVSADTPEQAFARYAAHRQPRTNKIASISQSNGRAFHFGFPANLARNLVVKLQGSRGHFKRLDWIYAYETPKPPVPSP